MVMYTLTIKIPQKKDRDDLRDGHYKLCISKQVGDDHNVVWSATAGFGASNKYEWEEEYEVFSSTQFKAGVLVETLSNAEKIKFGQTCTLDNHGEMGKATGAPDNSGAFYAKNDYHTINFGINGKIKDNVGTKFSPIFVSDAIVKNSSTTFKPKVIVHAWFHKEYITQMMYLQSSTTTFPIDYSEGVTDLVATYKGGDWQIG